MCSATGIKMKVHNYYSNDKIYYNLLSLDSESYGNVDLAGVGWGLYLQSDSLHQAVLYHSVIF